MATRPEYADELLERVERDGIRSVCLAYNRQPLSSSLLRELYRMSKPLEARLFLATYQQSPSYLLEDLERDCYDEAVVKALAGNPCTPRRVLSRLAEHIDSSVRALVASNPELDGRDIDYLINDKNECVRIAVTGNSCLSERQQLELCKDPSAAVRLRLASNPVCCRKLAQALASDTSPLVRLEFVASFFSATADERRGRYSLLERLRVRRCRGNPDAFDTQQKQLMAMALAKQAMANGSPGTSALLLFNKQLATFF